MTLVTASLGMFNYLTEREVGSLAGRIYDRAFLSMSYLRSAQVGFVAATAACGTLPDCPTLVTRAPDVLKDLEVAEKRAITPDGRNAVLGLSARLRTFLERERTAPGTGIPAMVAEMDGSFVIAVEILAGEGFSERLDTDALTEGRHA